MLDLTLHRGQVIEFDDFLRNYHSFKSDDTHKTAKGFTHRFYCRKNDSICARDVTYTLSSSLGICLLKKHQTLLKESNLFDLNDYGYYPHSPTASIDEDSFQNFIDRSNQLGK